MIGCGIIHREAQELFEGGPIVDLSFQLRIGINVKPLLKEEAFHQKYGRISFVSSSAFTDRIGSCKQEIDFGPVYDSIDLLHSFDCPVFFHMWEKRDIGEREVGLHFLESHRTSQGNEFAGIMTEKRGNVKY